MSKVYLVTNPLNDCELDYGIVNSALVSNGIDSHTIIEQNDGERFLVQIKKNRIKYRAFVMSKMYLVTNPLNDCELDYGIVNSALVSNGIDSHTIIEQNDGERFLVQIKNQNQIQFLEKNDYLLGVSHNNLEYYLFFQTQQGAQPSLSTRHQEKVSKDQLFCSRDREYQNSAGKLESVNSASKMDIDIDDQDTTVWVMDVTIDLDLKLLRLVLENEKLSGGGEIRRFERLDKSTVEVTFEKTAVVDRILKKSPLKFNDLIFPIIRKPKVTQAESESGEVEEKTIEVHGVPIDMELNRLQLYFENHRRSGGGKIMDPLIRDKITGTVLITFVYSEDAIRIIEQREHKFDDQTLVVNMHQRSGGKQFFLSEVNSDRSGNDIINFLEAKIDIAIDDVVKMENVWIVFCKDFVRFSDVQQLCKTHTFKYMSDTYPRVSPVPATDKALVKHFSGNKQIIQHYFKDCTSVTKLSEDRFLITFNNSSVVPEMCRKRHKVMDTELQLIPYYENLLVDGNYEEYVLDSSFKLEFMKKYHTTVEQMLQPQLKPIWSKSDGNVLKIEFSRKGNREKGLKILDDLLQNIHEEKIILPSPEMLSKAEEFIEKKPPNAIVRLDSVTRTLAIIAFDKDNLLKLKENLTSAGLSTSSESQMISMESYQVALIFSENFPQQMQEKYPGLLIETGQNKIIIKGRVSNFSEIEKEVYKFLARIKCYTVELPEHASCLLKNKQVKTHVTGNLEAKECTALWENKKNDSIIVFSLEQDQLPIASEVFKSSIKALNFGAENQMKDFRNHQKWKVFWQGIQTNYANLFYLDEETFIGVAIDSVEDKIKDEFEKFSKINVRQKWLDTPEKVQLDFLRRKKMNDIDDFCKKFGTENPVTITIRPDDKVSIEASEKDMDKAKAFIGDLIKKSGKNLPPNFQIKYRNQMINTHQSDITQLPVDAIVNAANQGMDHGGGVAKAIVDKGGFGIQTECKEILASKDLDMLPVGQAIITSGGDLPCQYIIHAVGPNWNGGNNDEKDQLSQAVKNSLKIADKKSLDSIAFSSISAGSYKYPLKEAVNVITSTVKKFLDRNPMTSLKTVSFVDNRPSITSEFERQMMEVFFKDTSEKNKAPQKSVSKPETARKMIIIKREELQNIKADVIVNSISNNLDFSRGKLSTAILGAAGKELQNECKKYTVLNIFQIIVTNGYNLLCRNVFHISLPYCQENARMIIRKYTEKCLIAADKYKASSIAFPSLGTGQLEYSTADVANVMMQTIYNHLNNASTSLKEVFIIIYPKDDNVFMAFQSESSGFQRRGINLITESKTLRLEISPKDSGKMTQGNSSNEKMKTENESTQLTAQGLPTQVTQSPNFFFGAVQIFIICGDLLDEQTDAIVHCTDAKFGLRGVVSNCLIKKCGSAFSQDCKSKASEMSNKHYAVTEAHHLKCEMILHLDVVSKLSEPEKIFEICFKAAEKYMISSLSIPHLATDGKHVPPEEMAAAMIKVISKLDSKFLKRVNVVLFQPKLVSIIKKTMDGAHQGSLIPAITKPTDVLKMSPLQKTNAEYKKVKKDFLSSLKRNATIKSIHKIINPTLKAQYEAQIVKMKAVNPQKTTNERILWHGTKGDCVKNICRNGFDRGYCGVNGVWHGQGVYFALASEYSDKDMYTPRDGNGDKHMLMCHVGTGVFVQGTPDMRILPKRPNSDVKYDSATNNPANPTVFIIFNDVQAYPGYYFTYT